MRGQANDLIERKIQFIHEQNGIPEKELKTRLSAYFHDEKWVKAAYLVKIKYEGSNDYSVALCLNVSRGFEKPLVDRVGAIFASMFGHHEHLDIMFLSVEQETQVARVCRPFFGS